MNCQVSTVVEPQIISIDELERETCKESFYAFVIRFWDTIIPDEPVWNWHVEVLCDEMQKVAERVFAGKDKEYDLLINVPPGSTKSTICSVMFPAWIWTRMPSAWSICGSYSYNLSMDLSRKCRDIVQSDKYIRLFGDELQLRADQNTKSYFINNSKGGRYSTSTGGTVTGYHGHFLIVDDPLNPTEAVSDVELKNANEWIGRTLSTRKKNKAGTPTILIMQRLHEDDPSGKMLEQMDKPGMSVRHICLPAEIDERNKDEVKPRYLRRYYVDGLLDPVRMSKAVLDEFRTKLLEYGFAGQFQQNPVPMSGGMFKTTRIIVGEPGSVWLQRTRFWDKAGTEGGGCFTVGVLMGEDELHRTWILDVVRVQLDTFEREVLIENTAKLDGLDVVVGLEQEGGSGGKESVQRTALSLRGWPVQIVNPVGDKVQRAKPFSYQVNAGLVHMVKAHWNDAYLHELALFPLGKYKDQVDATSGGFTVQNFSRGRVGVIK